MGANCSAIAIASLIARALGGEPAAFGELVVRYQDRLYNSLLRVLGSAEDARDAAQDAFVQAFVKLDTFRGQSRFTTWAYKFVLLEAGVKLRRRAWQGREVGLDDEAWPQVRDAGPTAHDALETAELLAAVRTAMDTCLSHHQREVFRALALNGVPIDVLAERLTTTRGALYKTLHDARRKLRAELAAGGLGDDRWRTHGS